MAQLRLTEIQKQKIVADWVETQNYSETARRNSISPNTVRNIVKSPNMQEFLELAIKKRDETIPDILEYMDSRFTIVAEIIDKGLNVLNSPGKLDEASPSQITTAIGTLLDKWLLILEAQGKTTAREDVTVIIDV